MPPFRRALIMALFLISLGGAMLHMRIHPVYVEDTSAPLLTETVHDPGSPRHQLRLSFEHLCAIAMCLVDVVIVTALFCSIRTVPLAYLLKGMFVIFGTVFMAHFSISELSQGPHPLMDWILKSTLSDILILWVGFFIGKAIYDSYTLAPA